MPDATHESIVNDKTEQLQFHFRRNQFIIMQPANEPRCSSSSQQTHLASTKYFSLKVNQYRAF